MVWIFPVWFYGFGFFLKFSFFLNWNFSAALFFVLGFCGNLSLTNWGPDTARVKIATRFILTENGMEWSGITDVFHSRQQRAQTKTGPTAGGSNIASCRIVKSSTEGWRREEQTNISAPPVSTRGRKTPGTKKTRGKKTRGENNPGPTNRGQKKPDKKTRGKKPGDKQKPRTKKPGIKKPGDKKTRGQKTLGQTKTGDRKPRGQKPGE